MHDLLIGFAFLAILLVPCLVTLRRRDDTGEL